jgi:HlyD family secretion protein
MKLKLIVLPILAVISLVYAVNVIAQGQPKNLLTEPQSLPPSNPFPHSVAGVGLVEPKSELISLAASIPGVVQEVLVKPGDLVKRGQVLVKLDTRKLQAEQKEAQAALEIRQGELLATNAKHKTAQASLDQASSAFAFVKQLAASKAVSVEDVDQRSKSLAVAEAQLAEATAAIAVAEAGRTAAQAALDSFQTELDRSNVIAPLDATVLQVRIRAGEFADAGPSSQPWLTLGDMTSLHVRVDIDEHDAWRTKGIRRGMAQARGNTKQQAPLSFVRTEPLIIPKRSLTGDAAERVDTRVLQMVLEVQNAPATGLYPGQQVDVILETTGVD